MTDDPLVRDAQSYARGRLSDKRFGHTVRVAQTVEHLAEAHGLDPQRARLAALLHDSAREMAPEEMLREAEERGLSLGEFERENPKILHGPVAAEMAREDLGVTDEGVLDAVREHTVGAVGMSPLSLAVFLADKIEPARDYPGIEELRALSEKNLREATKVSIRGSIRRNKERSRPVHPASLKTLAWLGDDPSERFGV